MEVGNRSSKTYIPSKEEMSELIDQSIGELETERSLSNHKKRLNKKSQVQSKRLWSFGTVVFPLIALNLVLFVYFAATQVKPTSRELADAELSALISSETSEVSAYVDLLGRIGRGGTVSAQDITNASSLLRESLRKDLATQSVLPQDGEVRIDGTSLLWYAQSR